jgi:hypothetical protein
MKKGLHGALDDVCFRLSLCAGNGRAHFTAVPDTGGFHERATPPQMKIRNAILLNRASNDSSPN